MSKPVLVVIGAGAAGRECARRLGAGRTVVIADVSEQALRRTRSELRDAGLEVTPFVIDVTDSHSVAELATEAANLGPVTAVVYAVGLTTQSDRSDSALEVGLLGAATTLEEFAEVIEAGGVATVITTSGRTPNLVPRVRQQLATTSAKDLCHLPVLRSADFEDAAQAAEFVGYANRLRVSAAAPHWAERDARVVSVSVSRNPGLLSRHVTLADVGAAVEYLNGPQAGAITGCDLRLDGGSSAAEALQ